MKTKHIFILFIIVACVQLFAPAQMILNQENILKSGVAYKFKTQPIDPSDPFRGKYITLRYELNSFLAKDTIWERGQDIYIYLKKDSLGFAQIDQVYKTEIESDLDFIITELNYFDQYQKILRFNLPYDRFYMNEAKAYDAEVAHREAQRDTLANNTYALLYIKEGEAVLENVFINEIPIADYVEK